MTFQAPKTIPGLEDESNRALTRALSDIQNDLSGLSGSELVTPVQTADYLAQLGEFVRTQPPTAGMKVLLPPGTAAVQSQIIPVTVQSVLSGGSVTVAVAGGTQKIDGNATKVLSVVGLTYFKCLGTDGWTCLSGDPNPGSIPLTDLAAIAANTVVANATAAAASPTAFPVGANTVLGRVAGNVVAAQLVGAQVAPATLPLTTLATQAANTVLANATAGVASPTAITVGAESVLGQTSGNLQGIASAVQTALIRAAGSVFWAAAAANQVLRRSGAGDLGFGLLVDGNLTANTISAASQAQMAANTVKSNATAALANESDLAVGTNTVLGRVAGNIVAAALVNAQITANTITAASQAQMAANSIKANATAGAANEADQALAVQSILLRAAANIVNAVAAAGQFLGRGIAGGDLSFQLKGLVSSNVTRVTATNATTNLSCGGSFSVPANTLNAGAVYRITGQYLYVHTAAALPTVTIEILLAGAVILTQVLTPIATATTYTGTAIGYMRCETTGAGGTVTISLDQKNTYVTFAKQSIENQSVLGTTACNTTIANTLEMRMRMTTAVAANTLTIDQGFIEKL